MDMPGPKRDSLESWYLEAPKEAIKSIPWWPTAGNEKKGNFVKILACIARNYAKQKVLIIHDVPLKYVLFR
jgi:hypothetical protein